MKFKFGVTPTYRSKTSTDDIMRDLFIALMFVTICSIVLQYSLYGVEGAIRGALLTIAAVATCYITDFLYFKALKTKKEEFKEKVNQNVPAITGIILALTMPLGDLGSYQIIYVTIISAIVAELIGKLIFGGFGYNIFNPAGVGRAFALLAFGPVLIIPNIDGLSAATVLGSMSSAEGMDAITKTFNDYSSLLFGAHKGTVGETMVIPIVLAGIYLVWKKVIDWVIPVVAMLAIFVFSLTTIYMNGYGLEYAFIQLFSGGLVFGAVFMLTDPVTNPNNRQGKIIFAITFALLTYLIRVNASLPEGVVFAILLCNMLVPMIDKLTANVTNTDTNKKLISVGVFSAFAIVLSIIFQLIK